MKVSLPIGYALVVLALLTLVSAHRVMAASYTIKDLGTLGGTESVANGINSTGQVVGQASNSAGAFLGFESQSSALVSTGLLSGGSGSTATGVNSSGEVVGSATDDLGYSHAYTYANGALQCLNGIAGGVNGYAMSINSSGEVAGSATNSLGSRHVVVWINGNLNDLGTLGGWSGLGESVNDSGHVAGYSYILGNAATHALYWDGATMHDLGTLGGTNSYAYCVNASNEVVGWSYTSGNTARHAFYWDGTMHDIGALSNSYSYAYGVNSTGQIVGVSAGAGFLYSNGVMTNLNTLLPANSGWTLNSANAINDAGQIVGWGITNGQVHAYLLSPPVVVTAPPPPPAAPTGLAASSATGAITLSWSASGGATSYNLYRATASGAEALYHSGLAATTFTDSGLANGATYYYEVTAVGAGGESARSNEATATTPVPTPAASAVFVKADSSTSGNWKGVYGADGFNILTDPSGNNPTMPAYAVLTPSGNSAIQWSAPGASSAANCLQAAAAGSTQRVAGAWYASTSFSVDLNLTDGNTHQVALYLLDWGNTGRAESVAISDANTGKVLDTRTPALFGNGAYRVWNITGHVKITFTRTGGSNCVLSGIFFR